MRNKLTFIILFAGIISASALTPKEREKLKLVRAAVTAAIAHNQFVISEAEALKGSAMRAEAEAILAIRSANATKAKAEEAERQAKAQHDELVRCAKENARMRPIVDAVTGPWWFPGGKALLYGAKKSIFSLIVIVAGAALIGFLLKVFAPGVWAALRIAGKAAGGFFGRIGKSGLAIVKRWRKPKKSSTDNINHRTIGSDD